MDSSEFVYFPNDEVIEKSNLDSLRKFFNLGSLGELYSYADMEMERFYEGIVTHMGIWFFKRFDKIRDSSGGKEFTKWFTGGQINITFNCVERHRQRKKDAIIWENENGERGNLTYEKLDEKSGKLAGALLHMGVKKGDRVGIYMPMIPEAIIAMYGIMRIGAVAVPMFSGYGRESVEVRVKDAGIKYIFTVDSYERKGKKVKMAETIRGIEGIDLIVVGGSGYKYDFYNLLEGGPYVNSLHTDSEDPAIMLYTSGTTGKPKGTVHVHGGTIVNITKEVYYYTDLKEDGIIYWITDLGWMMGPWEIIGANSIGATVFIYPGAVDYPNMERVWDMVERNKITVLGLSPTFVRTAKSKGVVREFKGLRAFASTGEPWDTESWMYLFQRLGGGRIPICNVSGGTDIIGCFLASTPVIPLKPRCLYRGLGMGVTVLSQEGKEITDEVGLLASREHLPSMTRGIWKDEKKYLETYWNQFKGYWIQGDWAVRDKDGYYILLGRADDVIKIAGKRLGPGEIEDAANRVESVVESACFGIPDPIKGESVVIFYTGNDDEAVKKNIYQQVERSLGKSFRPKYVFCIPSLPKTKNGKIMRRLLKAAFLDTSIGDVTGLDNGEILDEVRKIGKEALINDS
ncbi:AMP-binding protein [Cuniculiplasma sp. SKW3]|uniref:AMP-binding protein n=1 Tax=Cuniculiplasma sp. SKW3 TaxID=3400170 RepID=UPI003FD26033